MSGAGWTLKSGDINLDNNYILEDNLDRILNSKTVNSYKLFLLKVILEGILENKKEIEFEKVYRCILNNFYAFFSKFKNEINQKNKKSSLYMLLEEKKVEQKQDLENIKLKDLDFLNKYVFGALYNDTSGKIFGFSKSQKKIILNINIKNQINKELLLKLNYKLINDLGLEVAIEKEINEFKETKLDRVENLKDERGNYYQQKFALEIDYILNNLLKMYEQKEKKECFFEMLKSKSRQEMADELGVGVPKLQAQLQYMRFLNLFDGNDKTLFADKISKMNGNHDYIEPLLYYYLTKKKNEGGHYIYSELINEIIYKLFNDNFEFKISNSRLLEKMKELNIDKLDEKSWKSIANLTINCLTNSDFGFGKMAILEEVEGDKKNIVYEIHSYWVEPLVGAYIIYDLWKEGQTAMSINSLINDKYSLGRIYLMDRDAIMETLEEIQSLGLIDIETIAGLNQIRKSDKYSKEDILDMMIKNS